MSTTPATTNGMCSTRFITGLLVLATGCARPGATAVATTSVPASTSTTTTAGVVPAPEQTMTRVDPCAPAVYLRSCGTSAPWTTALAATLASTGWAPPTCTTTWGRMLFPTLADAYCVETTRLRELPAVAADEGDDEAEQGAVNIEATLRRIDGAPLHMTIELDVPDEAHTFDELEINIVEHEAEAADRVLAEARGVLSALDAPMPAFTRLERVDLDATSLLTMDLGEESLVCAWDRFEGLGAACAVVALGDLALTSLPPAVRRAPEVGIVASGRAGMSVRVWVLLEGLPHLLELAIPEGGGAPSVSKRLAEHGIAAPGYPLWWPIGRVAGRLSTEREVAARALTDTERALVATWRASLERTRVMVVPTSVGALWLFATSSESFYDYGMREVRGGFLRAQDGTTRWLAIRRGDGALVGTRFVIDLGSPSDIRYVAGFTMTADIWRGHTEIERAESFVTLVADAHGLAFGPAIRLGRVLASPYNDLVRVRTVLTCGDACVRLGPTEFWSGTRWGRDSAARGVKRFDVEAVRRRLLASNPTADTIARIDALRAEDAGRDIDPRTLTAHTFPSDEIVW